MLYRWHYKTPKGLDDIVMYADGVALTGLHFSAPHGTVHRDLACPERNLPVFRATCRWLDCYFSGRQPDFTPQYRLPGATPFRKRVSGEMLKVPFGATTTYGRIAATIARRDGGKMSAQAVGGAVGWNPICIIIPCHRVIGADGSLTGYGGGMHNKAALLRLEGTASCKSGHTRIPRQIERD